MKATIPIGLQPNTKLLRIERVVIGDDRFTNPNHGGKEYDGAWMIWIYHNPDFTLGTYLTLHSDGRVTNSTVKEDGTEEVFQVKGPD